MAKPVIFSIKDKPTQAEAIKFVSGQVKMHDVYFMQDDKFLPLNRKALIKNGKLAEIVSSSYTLVKHDDILSAALKSIRNQNKEIKSVGLDSDGDRMIAQIAINRTFEISSNNFVRPELLILNSYDHTFSAGFDLAFCHIESDSMGLTDYSSRWSHFGSTPENIDFKTVDDAIDHFEKQTLPLLKKSLKAISKDAAIKAVVAAEAQEVIPRKTARKLCDEVDNKPPKTVWDLFNLVSKEITHSMQISPSYRRQLWKEISQFFLYENFSNYASKIKLKDIEILVSNKRPRKELVNIE